MKRYGMILGWGGALMQERDDGDYVRFDDVAALLAVAEAARKVVQHTADFDLETALARLDGKENK